MYDKMYKWEMRDLDASPFMLFNSFGALGCAKYVKNIYIYIKEIQEKKQESF